MLLCDLSALLLCLSVHLTATIHSYPVRSVHYKSTSSKIHTGTGVLVMVDAKMTGHPSFHLMFELNNRHRTEQLEQSA
jgi:hypothetical protein